MKIAVVGGGIFGCTAALELHWAGHDVTLYEKESYLLKCASRINQYRLHSGYHYPRSIETALQSKNSIKSFKNRFSNCINSNSNNHYYAIANNSKVTVSEYIKFLHDVELEYEILNFDSVSTFINPDEVQCVFRVQEDSIDIVSVRRQLETEMKISGLKVLYQETFQPEFKSRYDVVINATYSNLNYLLDENEQVDYQFEICEKAFVRLNSSLSDKSLVIIDGEFGCLDPVPGMNCHVLGHVNHAVRYRSIGKFPVLSNKLNTSNFVLDNNTNTVLILNSLVEYVPSIMTNINYLGSLYTVRTVLPNRDHDDARPSYITKHSDNLYSIFSGKIGTCVDISKDLVKMI